MQETRDLFKKIRDTKGTFPAKIGTIKNRNMYLVWVIKTLWYSSVYSYQLFLISAIEEEI